jgi:hypothetical protein
VGQDNYNKKKKKRGINISKSTKLRSNKKPSIPHFPNELALRDEK